MAMKSAGQLGEIEGEHKRLIWFRVWGKTSSRLRSRNFQSVPAQHAAPDRAALERELQILKSLKHPNSPPYLDTFTTTDNL